MSQNVGIPQTQSHPLPETECEISMSRKFALEIGCIRVPKPNDATQQLFTSNDDAISRPVTCMDPTVLLVRGHSACVDQLNSPTPLNPIERHFGATHANKATKAFVRANDAFGHSRPSGSPHVPENYEFTGINPSVLPDTVNGNGVDPVGFELKTGIPSRRDIAMDMPYESEAPDLSGLVLKLDNRPVFTGTYSRVYVGKYRTLKVAIKVLCVVKSDSVTDRKFRRERFIWWQLRHPNVLPLFGYFEDDDGIEVSHALVSEWAEGGSAAQYIHHDLSWDRRMNLLYDVTKGLQYLHGMDPCVVHGDLKPLNVLINKDGVAQLCDFGLARLIQAKSGSGMTTTTAHTGTTRYLAYELVEYDDAPIPTTATDIYALGCLGLEFIYRVPPHASLRRNHGKITRAIGDGVPPAKRPTKPQEVVPILWDILEACWNNAPEERPTATQVSDYLTKNLEALSESLERCSWAPEYPTR